MKKIILLCCLLSVNIAANANQMRSSGPFYFQGGVVLPKNTLSIPLRQLLPIEENTPIVITCDIENTNYNKPYPAVIKLSTYMRDSNICSLNGTVSPTKLYLLDKQVSKYRVHTTYSYWETLNFQNYDESDEVSVTHCMAVYDTSY